MSCYVMMIPRASDDLIILRRTSEIRATHLTVSLTIADTPAHGLPGHTGVGASVVGLGTNDQAVLIRIVALRSHCDVTWRGHGQRPTFTADAITSPQGAALRAAVPVFIVGPDSDRLAVTVSGPKSESILLANALISAHLSRFPPSVVAGVGVAGDCGVNRPHCRHQ